MKITCQSCQSKYTVSDDKVQGKTVKIKCRKCGSTIVVSSNGVTTSNGAGGGGADAQVTAAGTYLVNVAEGDQRSMTLQEIVDAYNSSVVTAETYVWADGMADWAPIGQVEAITSALSSPSPEAAAPRVAARREPGRHAQDVFGGGGGMETQAAADDVATSAPLFGKGSAAAPKPKAGEENSMLFSLSALTAKAAPAGASGAKGPMNTEDSGIIDLKALAAAAEARSKSQAAASAPPPVSGLGALMR
ncbi:MAG: zinc-ribbon domain-containing protein, partial [Polyangiaceae bacterium]|nr:zinc-ribbon domain-containing protein [Polyangiaceae bacterium]